MAPDTDIIPPRYRDPQLIGHGGMGEIYRAQDQTLGRTVAIKVLAERFSRNEDVRGRFTREALAAARLSGEPSAITIFDVGEHAERPFIVMEYAQGGSLEDLLSREGAQDPDRVVAWLEQAAAALDAAHAKGVVHRDVKPGNLLLAADGTLRVADFGVASAAGLDSLTMTGTVLGTAGYLAPEQAQGQPTTPATDRYALGVVAYELLTGKRPFESDSLTAEASAHVHAEVPSISEQSGLSHDLDPIFRKALAKDPGQRYRTAADFVAAMRQALGGDTRPTSLLPAKRRSDRRLSWPLVGAFLAAAAVAGAGLAAIISGSGDRKTSSLSIVTRTLPGTTLRQTVTKQTTAPQPPPPPPAPTGGNGLALTDEATRLIRERDFAGAERAARQAVAALAGSGQPYEAYAEYDLGRALAELGRCAEALQHLDRSEQLQGQRKEIDRARKSCK
jgi:serine/threonine protein kinase